MTTKFEYLDKIRKQYPSTIILFYDKETNQKWSESKEIKDCSDIELEQANLLRILPHQIIIDIENKELLNDTIEKIQEKDWGYEIWDTGSRGYHIYLEFDNIEILDLDVRQMIRKFIINFFNADLALSKDAQFIACPHGRHFKTGKIKHLLESNYKMNSMSNDIIQLAKEETTIGQTVKTDITDDRFKNYLNDSFLNYVLGRQLESGERNDVVFKNIAIGLVRCGLTKEDIVKVAKRVVNNCPGKSLSEFMGWADKAQKGEIIEYNYTELNKWAIKYSHPMPYPERLANEQEVIDLQYNEIKTLWSIIWNSRIVRQDIWKQMLLFNMIGTFLDEREEDYRLHLIFSSPSGSGKDEGINIVYDILKKLGMSVHKPSSITDRTLIGAVNIVAVEFNTKNKEKIEQGKIKEREEKDLGILSTAHWIAFAESETVFRPSAYNKQLHVLLRQAMDKTRFIEKGVTGRMLNTITNTSFVFSTYTMNKTIYALLDNGLFQRAIYYNKEIEEDDHDAIVAKMFDIITKTETKKTEEIHLIKLLDKMREMKKWYSINKDFISWFKGSEKYMYILWYDYKKTYDSLDKYDKGSLNSMLRRGVSNIIKLLKLNSICQMKDIISKEDIDMIFSLYVKCMDSVADVIKNQDPELKRDKGILRILKNGAFTTMRVHEEMNKQLSIKTDETRRKIIKRLIDTGKISEVIDGNKKLLILTDLGRSLVDYE